MIPLRATELRSNGDVLHWPNVRLVAPRRFQLQEDYLVEWQAAGYPRQRLCVPAGFECDGASVPALLEWYLGRERILPAAVPHDWHYAFAGHIPPGSHHFLNGEGVWAETNHVWSRLEADRFFARNLKFCEISDHQRRNGYRAVRLGGVLAWRRARRNVVVEARTSAGAAAGV